MDTLRNLSLTFALISVAMPAVNAQVLVLGNMGAANNAAFGGDIAATGARALGFNTGSTTLTKLERVDLSLAFDNTVVGTAVPVVRIFSDPGANGPIGDSSIATLSLTSGTLGATASTLSFTPSSTLVLQNNSTYFIVVDNGGSGELRWFRSTTVGESVPTASNGYSLFSPRYSSTTTDDFSSGTTTTLTPNFAVYASVPEPSEYALLAGIGLCAFAAYRRRVAA